MNTVNLMWDCAVIQGFVHGVTGVVTKPVEGAKQEGVGGFFKGGALEFCY